MKKENIQKISEEEAIEILRVFGKSPSQAKKALGSRSGRRYFEIAQEYADKIRLGCSDLNMNIIDYLHNNFPELYIQGKNNARG